MPRRLLLAVLLMVAAVVLGTAIAKAGPRPYGIAYAVLIPLFTVSGFVLPPAQPPAAFAFAAVTAVLAARWAHLRKDTGNRQEVVEPSSAGAQKMA